jgi:Txe/YoeB family toxin of Txe-Axe toxin-antitoxin module
VTYAYTIEFRKQVEKYRSMSKHIKRKVILLLEDPYRNCKSEPLRHQLKGLRSARLTQNLRIIFAICEEAKTGVSLEVSDLCNELGGKTVVFITIDVHGEVYR